MLAGDLAARLDRWPGFVSQALDLGIEGVYAFPLQLGATCLGVLDLYAEHSGATLNGLLPTALSFAQAAVLTLLDAVEGEAVIEDDKTADLGEAGRGLYEAFDHRPEIHQAQGMVMVDLAVPLTQALLRMRARAFGTGTTLLELSRRIIDGEEDPRTWDADLPPKGHEDGPPGLRSDTGGTS